MNTQLSKLAKQATEYAITTTKDDASGFMYNYTEKLAELIITDCAFIAENIANNSTDTTSPIELGYTIRDSINRYAKS